ncbi:hypothetical protein HTZ84_07735 [Haloterrigena sp. SYSU A558-1]|uniref:Uncharacterized protein n=1 Tax=Haloterrigena gelatinilytica TaxID=2741724 RepID=A0A8J8GPA7_9EURY|nr:hypothetical protein [Haloterrigena gelatinilytica]NUB91974.1 hypothetical protein [Haloterrigena gelatinilytica]NUC72200.1 hypothetical protein [Haloterrigena gelatinilytica]
MSDESRFDANADREPLDEQTITEDEPPPAVEFVADDGSTDEDEVSDEDSRQARERREGTGESLESDEGEDVDEDESE